MGLYIDIPTELSENIHTTYHRIGEFSFNSFTGAINVTVFSFISFEDAESGKSPYSQATYKLSTIDPATLIVSSNVGASLFAIVQTLLESAIVREIAQFSGATIA